MNLYDRLQMQGLPAEQQAAKAIGHLLRRCLSDDRVYHLMGLGSQSFDLLTEAYATLTGADLVELRKALSGGEASAPPPSVLTV